MSTPFYAVCNHNKPLAQLYLSTRRAEYAAWLKLIPALEEDFELVTEQCARHCGQSPNTVTKTLLALQRLTRELPLLYAVLEKYWHLDFPRIVAIDTAMSKLGPNASDEVISEIDAKIARYLTPRIENQQLPTPDRIAQRVRQLVNEFDDRIPVKDPRPQRRVVKSKLTANSSSLAVEAPHD
ncbi:MAG: HNH endonuclease signature motif containing protein, partial [Corynebacterium casei]